MASGTASDDAPLATTSCGAVRGERVGDIAVFRGIPYAAPPVGPLRWAPPEAVTPWSGVRDATRFAADPMQRLRPKRSRAPGISEDCLHVTVWSPAKPGETLPVMVWLFGGGFLNGSACDSVSDGEAFARQGVVAISISSRTGIFGWLAHPELAAESPHGSAGNYGLLDCAMALRWIRENAASFGGDPARITAFGVSSGGATLALLLTSPLARGAVDQAILQSAGSFRPLATLATAMEAGGKLGDLATLRGLSADAVLALEPKLIPAMRGLTSPRVLRPIHDGWVLPRDERAAYEQGSFDAVPAIIGAVGDEGWNLVTTWPVDTQVAWRETIEANFAGMVDEAAALYPVAADAAARRAVADMFGDSQFQLGARELARCFGARQPRTFRYVFTRQRAGIDGGPYHGGEVPYVFGHLDVTNGPTAEELPPAQRDIELSRAIQAAWVRFAATGDPGPFEGVAWPRAKDGFLAIGDELRVERQWRDAQLDFLNKFARQSGAA